MVPEWPPEVQDRRADRAYRVSVSVTHFPTGRARRVRDVPARVVSGRWLPPVVLALGVSVLAVVLAVVLGRGRTGPVGATAGATQRAGTAAVAAAFGYPQRCLSIAISAAEPDYASAHVDRGGGCGNYRGYINASFHRVDGVWRLILDEGQLFVPNRLLTPAPAGFRRAGSATGYPIGCLSVEIALHDARFDRAAFDRSLPCVRDVRRGQSRLSGRARRRASPPA